MNIKELSDFCGCEPRIYDEHSEHIFSIDFDEDEGYSVATPIVVDGIRRSDSGEIYYEEHEACFLVNKLNMFWEKAMEFRTGDRVWCSLYGWGNITEILKDSLFGVYCEFDNGNYNSFTLDGKLDSDGLRVLFFDKVVPQKSALRRPNSSEIGESIYGR
jgi:hypothetical protein